MSGSILFDGVWKKFQRGERHDSLRDLIPNLAKKWIKGRPPGELDTQEFWAVKDVSFEVKPGEALGIVGSNGAGKSTILKLLTRILKPTRGRCQVTGRIGALIEIAAGFHPDLTGRENVYLQGAIMGMKRSEIAVKFDQIVEFSGVSEFIDTQVKRYSSGMNARLGFAIAAHLDPEVLLIDEVLSVGDFAFQQKAFGRMQEIVKREIPIVVVSHQLDRIASLCTQAVLIKRGAIVRYGSPAEVITEYVHANNKPALSSERHDSPILLTSLNAASPEAVCSGDRLTLNVTGEVLSAVESDQLGVAFRIFACQTGQMVFATSTSQCQTSLPERGDFEVELDLQMNVQPGVYLAETSVWDYNHQREVAAGHSVYLQVRQEGLGFLGVVQMNPSLRLLSASSRR